MKSRDLSIRHNKEYFHIFNYFHMNIQLNFVNLLTILKNVSEINIFEMFMLKFYFLFMQYL